MTTTGRTADPYVGPRTFEETDADRFFGREGEARELVALVVSERLTLFYAQSGAGKSSLLNARVIPRLRDEEGFDVLPVSRVSGVLPAGVDPASIANIYIYHLIHGLSQKLPAPTAASRRSLRPAPSDLRHTSLAQFLAGLRPDAGAPATTPEDAGDVAPLVLVIDQFEELLTTYPARWQERAGFFTELATAMAEHPHLWVVLTLREDYIASLEPFSHFAPNRLRARFYMQRMGIKAALEAVERPAAQAGRPFAEGVAGRLVENLRRVRTVGQAEYHAGEYVEPVQLQVVCLQLWEDLAGRSAADRSDADRPAADRPAADRPAPSIELADLERLAGGGNLAEYVDRALSDFYERAVAKVVETPGIGVTEQALRTWFTGRLITEAGTRSIVFRNEATGRTEGLPNRAVELLSAQFLLRTELRAGGAWVELAHDRLVEPIRDSNAAWFQKHQSTLQRQAAIWRDEGRPADRLLLAGDDLAEAERWAAGHAGELEPHERDLIAASQAAREVAARALAAEREAARQRELDAARTLAEEQGRRADEQARAAEGLRRESQRTRRVAAAALLLALLAVLSLAAALLGQRNARSSMQVAQVARATEAAAAEAAVLADANAQQAAAAAAQAEASAQLAAAAETAAREQASTQLAAQAQTQVQGGALDLALLLGAEALRIADTPAGRQALENALISWPEVQVYLRGHAAPVASLAFSPDGGQLYSGDSLGQLVRWTGLGTKLGTEPPISRTLATELGMVQALTTGAGPDVLAAGLADGRIGVWSGARQPPRWLSGHTDAVSGLAFGPDDRLLASVSFDGQALLWRLAGEGDAARPEEGARPADGANPLAGAGPVTALAFSPAGDGPPVLATGGPGGRITLWRDLDTGRPTPEVLPLGAAISATVTSLAFDATGGRLAVGFDDGQFTAWEIGGDDPRARGAPLFAPVAARAAPVESLAFSGPDAGGPDAGLVILYADGALNRSRLADLASGAPYLDIWTQAAPGTWAAALAADGRGWALGLDSGSILLGRAGRPPLDARADREALIEQACHIAGRNLYEIEWQVFRGDGVPYSKTCAEFE